MNNITKGKKGKIMDRERFREKVTVKMAKEFLDSRKPNQRNLGERHVSELAEAMLMNRWVENGESIKFDTDGFMIDGQHRCAACIKAGKSFITDIVYGLPANARYTIDLKHKARSPADVLRMNGEVNTRCLASALLWNMAYLKKAIGRYGKQMWITPDSQEVCAELSRHPTMRESVLAGMRAHNLMAKAPLAFLHYRFKQKDKDLAKEFFHKLQTGEELVAEDPILHIRKMILADKIRNKAKLPMGEKVANIIKAWNLMRNGKKANSRRNILWRSLGKNPEPFPEII